jgi:glycerol kinase
MKYILAIDQGTTGTRSCLIDVKSFDLVAHASLDYPQIYPKPSWVEHNLNDIWNTVEQTITNVLKKQNAKPEDIVSIGITNQRETTCAFDKNGNPLANAIVWQDKRTSDFCQSLVQKNLSEKIKTITGLTIDPYFSGSKMRWLIQNNKNVASHLSKDDCLFGTIDTFLLYKLTGNSTHKTDASNASRTLLMDLSSSTWSEEMLTLFEIPKKTLPEISDSIGLFGKTKGLSILPDGIPITGILGDQQSALFGQAGYKKGEMKCTYGTGAFVLLNVGDKIVYSKSGLLSTALYRYQGKTFYALEGSSYIAGAAVQWLRDNLKIIEKSTDIEPLARKVKNVSECENILFFPFFSGIGSPHWKPEAKGAIVGLTRDSNQSHIALACLEGICLSINDLLGAMKSDTDLPINNLKVDGGASANSLLMELQATISDTLITRPKIIETTAYGAALASAIGANLLNFDQLEDKWKKDVEFQPNLNISQYIKNKKVLWNTFLNKLF